MATPINSINRYGKNQSDIKQKRTSFTENWLKNRKKTLCLHDIVNVGIEFIPSIHFFALHWKCLSQFVAEN